MNLIILDTPYTCHEPDFPLLLQNGCKTLLYFLRKHVHFVASADSLHSTGQGLHTQYARETLCRPAIVIVSLAHQSCCLCLLLLCSMLENLHWLERRLQQQGINITIYTKQKHKWDSLPYRPHWTVHSTATCIYTWSSIIYHVISPAPLLSSLQLYPASIRWAPQLAAGHDGGEWYQGFLADCIIPTVYLMSANN